MVSQSPNWGSSLPSGLNGFWIGIITKWDDPPSDLSLILQSDVETQNQQPIILLMDEILPQLIRKSPKGFTLVANTSESSTGIGRMIICRRLAIQGRYFQENMSLQHLSCRPYSVDVDPKEKHANFGKVWILTSCWGFSQKRRWYLRYLLCVVQGLLSVNRSSIPR